MAAYSIYDYVRPQRLPDLIHTMASVTNNALAAQFISDAERIIDVFVGPWPSFYPELTLNLSATLASGATTLQSSTLGDRRPNWWAQGGVYVVVKDGPSALIREKRLVVASDTDQLTLASGFPGVLTAGSAEVILRQESKFPRWEDCDAQGDPFLPPQLEAAVAYQVEYGIHFGSEEFGLGDSVVTVDHGEVQSRSYGSGYSESRFPNVVTGFSRLVAPKARGVLKPLMNRTGRLRG